MKTPAFVFNTLQQELQDIQVKLLENISKTYDIPLEELKEQFLSDLKIVPEAKDKIYICKKYKSRRLPMEEDRCQALIWNKGKGGQCSRPKYEYFDFCKQHKDHLCFGCVEKPKQEDKFAIQDRAIYK
jgi:hypothetical protein